MKGDGIMCYRTKKMYKGRLQVKKIDKQLFTIVDKEYKFIGYPLFQCRSDAEKYRAGIYGLTQCEYRRWKG